MSLPDFTPRLLELEAARKDLEHRLGLAVEALETAWAAMCERRGYAEGWEWKYGQEWNEEDAKVESALSRIKRKAA